MERESIFLMEKSFKKFTIGIEEEYMICDPKTGDLVNRANIIMNHFKDLYPERFSFELIEAEIESNTSVHYEIRDAIKELSLLRSELKTLGKTNDFSIGISGTHPTGKPLDQKFITNESYNWVSNQLGYYAQRNMTFSTHMHITIPEFEYSVNVMNGVRRWIAPLLALSVNSPFFDGQKTKMRSSRTMQFGAFPRTNIPNKFNSLNDYINYNEKLIESKSIVKNRHVWWKIRPHLDYKTIEFRVCDAQRSLENVRILSSLCRALTYTSFIDFKKNKLFEDLNVEFLNDSLWKASRFGFDSLIYDEALDKIITMKELILLMYEYSYEALKIFGDEDIINGIHSILDNGTECDAQLDVYKKYGYEGLKLFLINNVDY
jgi:glutamate---cysteine ligase / carboxylate-amine ligase